jgi:Holliday junction resolvase RusA-like endonuclease
MGDRAKYHADQADVLTARNAAVRPVQGRTAALKRTAVSPAAPSAESGAQGAWRLVLAYPPSTNNLYMTVRGHRVKTPEARLYAGAVQDAAAMAKLVQGAMGPPPYRLTLELWAPDRRRRDADNGVKCLQDALLKCTGHDDSEVVELYVFKRGRDRAAPRVEVTLEPIESQEEHHP